MGRDEFFHALKSFWITMPPGIQDSFLGQTNQFIQLEHRLREDESLAAYDREIYPELVTLLRLPSEERDRLDQLSRPRAVLHVCNHQLQIMENVFLAVNLGQYHAHPLNRGWMNLFRRWTATPTMQLVWPSLKSMYSKDFVAFAQYQLNLSGTRIEPEPKEPGALPHPLQELFELRDPAKAAALGPSPTPHQRLFRELGQEWPMSEEEKAKERPKDPLRENYGPYFEPFLGSTAMWTISHPESAGQEIWGMALLAPHTVDENWLQSFPEVRQWLESLPRGVKLQRLMVWIRPAFRGVGLGTSLLNAVFSEIGDLQLLGLIVMLPPLRRDRSGYAEEMAGWLRFYGQQGFVRATTTDAQRIVGRLFDPAAFCLVLPELLERLRKTPRQGDTPPGRA